uniref:Uncharacterized protein n=1 Tax=Cannabis sativa TaxID=3483 RepID=A0A803PHP2_CANSA
MANLLLPSRDWDTSKLHTLFEQETINNIIKGGKPCGQGRDRWVWTKESNGLFSTKFAYLIQALERAPLCNVSPALWNKYGALKFRNVTKSFGGAFFQMLCVSLPFSLRECILRRSLILFVGERGDDGTSVPLLQFCFSPLVVFSLGVVIEKLFLYASIVMDIIWRVYYESCLFASSKAVRPHTCPFNQMIGSRSTVMLQLDVDPCA